MNILILNTQIPYCSGGAEVLAQDLCAQLELAGHNAEIMTLPFKWYPQQTLVNNMLLARLLDVTSFNGVTIDRIIPLKFPLWLVPHEHKSLWILHQHRTAYDLWDSGYSDLAAMPDGRAVKDMIRREDSAAIGNSDRVCTISRTVSARLKKHNGIDSEVLYPPPRGMETFYLENYDDYFFFPSRVTQLKRQELVIESLVHVPEPVKVLFAGDPDSPQYLQQLKARARELGVDDKITWLGRISEQEKLRLYANALAVVFPPVDEDYGYITPEAMLSSKAVLTLEDSGGAAEFVLDGETGLLAEPTAEAMAAQMSRLWNDRSLARELGANARDHIAGMDLSWRRVLDGLL